MLTPHPSALLHLKASSGDSASQHPTQLPHLPSLARQSWLGFSSPGASSPISVPLRRSVSRLLLLQFPHRTHPTGGVKWSQMPAFLSQTSSPPSAAIGPIPRPQPMPPPLGLDPSDWPKGGTGPTQSPGKARRFSAVSGKTVFLPVCGAVGEDWGASAL